MAKINKGEPLSRYSTYGRNSAPKTKKPKINIIGQRIIEPSKRPVFVIAIPWITSKPKKKAMKKLEIKKKRYL